MFFFPLFAAKISIHVRLTSSFSNSELMIDVPKSCRQGMYMTRRYCGGFQQVTESNIKSSFAAFILNLGKPSTSLNVLDGREYQIHATARG